MLRLHFLFGNDVIYDGPVEDTDSIQQFILDTLGLAGKDRYIVCLFTDEHDPLLRHIYIEDRAISETPFDVGTLPCYVTKESPRCTIWINPPNKSEDSQYGLNTYYTEYYQYYSFSTLTGSSHHTVKYWRTFDYIELLRPTPLAVARYKYLLDDYEKKCGTGGTGTGGASTGTGTGGTGLISSNK